MHFISIPDDQSQAIYSNPHVIFYVSLDDLSQHAQTKKPMNIRKLTYSIDPSVPWSEPL